MISCGGGEEEREEQRRFKKPRIGRQVDNVEKRCELLARWGDILRLDINSSSLGSQMAASEDQVDYRVVEVELRWGSHFDSCISIGTTGLILEVGRT